MSPGHKGPGSLDGCHDASEVYRRSSEGVPPSQPERASRMGPGSEASGIAQAVNVRFRYPPSPQRTTTLGSKAVSFETHSLYTAHVQKGPKTDGRTTRTPHS